MRANLLRSVSHDLRTPLTTIYGSSQALIENYESLTDTQHMELLEGIREDTQWLIHMVENLLSVTRIGDTDVNLIKTSVVLEELIDSVLVKFQKWFPDQTVEATLPDEFVCIAVDSVLIQQVLGNLLENAVFHAEGMPRIILTIYKNEEKVLFEVADDGAGIPFEMLGSIFTGYYEKNYRGTPADLSSLYEKDLKTMSGNKHKILIVEDKENILKFIKTVLSAHGYSVLCAKSGLVPLPGSGDPGPGCQRLCDEAFRYGGAGGADPERTKKQQPLAGARQYPAGQIQDGRAGDRLRRKKAFCGRSGGEADTNRI